MSASTTGAFAPLGELRGMGRLSRQTFRERVELEPPSGKKLTVVMHSDINPASGKVFKDYEGRRRKVRQEEESSAGDRHFGTVDDVYPDD